MDALEVERRQQQAIAARPFGVASRFMRIWNGDVLATQNAEEHHSRPHDPNSPAARNTDNTDPSYLLPYFIAGVHNHLSDVSL